MTQHPSLFRGWRAAKMPVTLALVLALALALGACSTSGGSGTPETSSAGLRSVLQEARNNPDSRDASKVYCLLSISERRTGFPYKPFFAGLFAVAAEDGAKAFCAALVEGAVSGEITEADLAPFDQSAATRGRGPLGTLLRKLMVAHLRLETQEAAAPPPTPSTGPQPPQS